MIVLPINKANNLVASLNKEASLDPEDERWGFIVRPTPDGLRAKIEVRDEEGKFIAYMGE